MGSLLASILVPVHDDLVGLEITLRSLSGAGAMRADIEVIVCNDGGGPEVGRLAAKYRCREARLERNVGSYAARNAGLALARGQVIAFLDADERVTPSWLDAGIAALRTAEYVGGRIVVEPPVEPDVWHRFDCASAFAVERYLARMRFAPTANLFVRREVFERVGTFREDLYSGGDREFGFRVHSHGYRQAFCADAVTSHPARGRREQFRKLRRIGHGTAELRINVWRESRALVLFGAVARVIKVAPELLWRLARHLSIGKPRLDPDQLLLIVIQKLTKALFHYHVSMRTISLTMTPGTGRAGADE